MEPEERQEGRESTGRHASAMACGVARSRNIRFQKYCIERLNERRGHKWTRNRCSRLSRVRRRNNIGSYL